MESWASRWYIKCTGIQEKMRTSWSTKSLVPHNLGCSHDLVKEYLKRGDQWDKKRIRILCCHRSWEERECLKWIECWIEGNVLRPLKTSGQKEKTSTKYGRLDLSDNLDNSLVKWL